MSVFFFLSAAATSELFEILICHLPGILTMPSKQQDVSQSISPVLFMTVDGEPMSFFLRPGPVKRKLQPLITAGGGLLCNVQQPGAILLIDPEERSSVLGSAVHW